MERASKAYRSGLLDCWIEIDKLKALDGLKAYRDQNVSKLSDLALCIRRYLAQTFRRSSCCS